MSQKQLIQQLKIREQELIKELEAIQVLVGTYDRDDDRELDESAMTELADNVVLPKGKMSWEDYSVYLLEKLGGEAKASKVADIAVQANPNESEKTVRTAIKGKLSKNHLNGRIDAVKSPVRKEGYTYKTIQRMRRTKFPESSSQ